MTQKKWLHCAPVSVLAALVVLVIESNDLRWWVCLISGQSGNCQFCSALGNCALRGKPNRCNSPNKEFGHCNIIFHKMHQGMLYSNFLKIALKWTQNQSQMFICLKCKPSSTLNRRGRWDFPWDWRGHTYKSLYLYIIENIRVYSIRFRILV